MTLYVGTSGWANKEWKPDFYPQDLPQSRWLKYYGTTLTACEINATFYRLQTDATITKWADATPDSFRFATKAHRRITHSRVFPPDSEGRSFIDEFLRSVSILGPRLGVVLFQFPPHRVRDDRTLKEFLAALPSGVGYALEFRNQTWNTPDVFEAVAERGATVCVSDTTGHVPDWLPPGPLAYVRLRAERYTPDQRDGWRVLLEKEAGARHVYAFTKHEGIPAGDPFGGVGLARWLVSGG